ncbi:MAG: hypothetical protein QHI48_09690 [Bacteroidota bacterium]|nr:hypothetical protein [Bacteroidota bacterium]
METAFPLAIRPSVSVRSLFLRFTACAVLSAAAQYLWLYRDAAGFFRLWGFPVLPAFLVPLPFLPFIFSVRNLGFRGLLCLLGKLGDWLVVTLMLALVFGSVVVYHALSGGAIDPSWEWLTLAMGAGLDMPLVIVWVLPMLIVQDLFWRTSVYQVMGEGKRAQGALLSAFFWTLANAFLAVRFIETGETVADLAAVWMIPASGLFLYRLQRDGALILSAFALVFIATAWILLFGGSIPEINRVLFGCDVEKVTGLFEGKHGNKETYSIVVAAALTGGVVLQFLRKRR